MKKRILLDNEASYLNTGYSNYGREILTRLYNSGKYEIAEFASYGHWSDERQNQFPWKQYGNMPNPNDAEANHIYNSNPLNQFGAWRFEEVCLDFRPQIIFSIRDHWMFQYEVKSPFRRFYNLAHMPTCDSSPQPLEWVADYKKCDAIFTYTDWATKQLRKQGVDAIREHPPGVNLNLFKPVQNRKALRDSVGVEPDNFIIGTVMRNQKRKLYPELIDAFAKFIHKYGNTDIGKKTYLYIHTSYPDIGWDIPTLIKESNVSHRILLTYICKKCRRWFPSLFHDARQVCKFCKSPDATLPNTQVGLPDNQLPIIYNLFNCYVQLATREGIGMPQLESGGVGTPIFTMNYSGCADIVTKLRAIPIKINQYVKEAETGGYGVYPDTNDLVQKWYEFFSLPESIRLKMGFETAQLTRKYYNYDTIAALWMEYFDAVDVTKLPNWDEQPSLFQPHPERIPQNINTSEFVKSAFINIIGTYDPSDYLTVRLLRDLTYNASMFKGGVTLSEDSLIGIQSRWKNFGPQDVINELMNICNNRNKWELERVNKNRTKPDFIQNAYGGN